MSVFNLTRLWKVENRSCFSARDTFSPAGARISCFIFTDRSERSRCLSARVGVKKVKLTPDETQLIIGAAGALCSSPLGLRCVFWLVGVGIWAVLSVLGRERSLQPMAAVCYSEKTPHTLRCFHLSVVYIPVHMQDAVVCLQPPAVRKQSVVLLSARPLPSH